jgi:uncharacterized protein YciI
MPLYVLRCLDAEGTAALRDLNRDAHVAHVRGSGVVRIAGPILNESDTVVGSVLIIDVQNIAQARDFSDSDPFRRAGVYLSVDIHPFRMTYTALQQSAPSPGTASQVSK